MKDIQKVDESIATILENNIAFHEEEKIKRLKNAITQFISLCDYNAHELMEYLSTLINHHPSVKRQDLIFQRNGYRLLSLSIPFSIRSGVVTVTKNITTAFEQNGANVALINHWWHKYSYFDKDRNEPVNVKMSPYCLLTGDGVFVEMRWALKQVLADLLDVHKYTPHMCHVHTHTFYEDGAISVVRKYFPRVPIVYTLHAFIPYIRCSKEEREKLIAGEMSKEEILQIRKKYSGREKSQEKMICEADKIITISPVHKEAFDFLYPEFREKCVCIPNGTDFELCSDLAETIAMSKKLRQRIAPDGERVIVYVGRVEAQKGAKRLVEGFNLIAQKYSDVILVLVGVDKRAESILLSNGLQKKFLPRVYYAGWVKDKITLAAYYRLSDAMIQPVFSKNLYAMVALEAMIMKVPVISCPGELTIGSCESPQSILEAIDIIFHDPNAVKRHVENIQKTVMADYSLDAIYRKHQEVYASTSFAPEHLKELQY